MGSCEARSLRSLCACRGGGGGGGLFYFAISFALFYYMASILHLLCGGFVSCVTCLIWFFKKSISAVGMASRVNIFMGLNNNNINNNQNLLSLAQINNKTRTLLVLVSRTLLSQEGAQILHPNRTKPRFFLFLYLKLYIKKRVFYVVTWTSKFVSILLIVGLTLFSYQIYWLSACLVWCSILFSFLKQSWLKKMVPRKKWSLKKVRFKMALWF